MKPLPLLLAALIVAPRASAQVPPAPCKDLYGRPCGVGGGGTPTNPPPGQDDEAERRRQADKEREIKEKLEAAKKKAAEEAKQRREEELKRASEKLQKDANDAARAKEIGDAIARRPATGTELALLERDAEKKYEKLMAHEDLKWRKYGLAAIQVRQRVMMTLPDGPVEPLDRGTTAILAGSDSNPGKGTTVETGPTGRFDVIIFEGHELLIDKNSSVTIYKKPTLASKLDEVKQSIIDVKEGTIRWIHKKLHPGEAEAPPSAPPKVPRVRVKYENQIRTPNQLIGSRGTDFLLKVDANGSGELALFEGEVDIQPISGGAKTVLKGPRAISLSPTSIGPERPLAPADFDPLR